MHIPFGDLRRQFKTRESEIRAAIDRVLERGWFIQGEEVSAFEREFSEYVSCANAVAVGSGTAAIQLALVAAGVEPGDEVVTAANTCVPTVAAICAAGATPVLADVDARTLTLSPKSLEGVLTSKTRAVVPVHLYGQCCDMDGILGVCGPAGIKVVEDCAQAQGALYKGRPCGTLGDAAAFSFYPSKNLGAYGDGGMVVTGDEDIAESVRQLRNYGESHRYHAVRLGVNSRLDEIQAAILRTKLRYLDKDNHARRETAAYYSDMLKHSPLTLPEERDECIHCYHLYVVRTTDRDALMKHLEARGIGAQIHYPVPIHLQPGYAFLEKTRADFLVSETACDEVLSLPLYPELTSTERADVANAVLEFWK